MSNNIKVNCERCGKSTPHTEKGSATENDTISWGPEDDQLEEDIQWTNLLLQCDICEHVSLYYFSPDVHEELTQLFPVVKDLNGVPLEVVSAYFEAKKVKNISPLAFVGLIRRSLEYVCVEQRAVGKDLYEKLKDLSDKGVIPPTLSKMSHTIRHFGNIGIHANDTKIDISEVRITDDFFIAVLEYVYIAPQKLKKAEEHIKTKK